MISTSKQFINALANGSARIITTGLLLASGLCAAEDSFTSKINAAKTSSSADAAKTKVTTAVNTTVELASLILAAVGFMFFVYGIFWIMQASRSEGRKESQPGWVMVVLGGVLGTAAGVYYLVVAGASAIGS